MQTKGPEVLFAHLPLQIFCQIAFYGNQTAVPDNIQMRRRCSVGLWFDEKDILPHYDSVASRCGPFGSILTYFQGSWCWWLIFYVGIYGLFCYQMLHCVKSFCFTGIIWYKFRVNISPCKGTCYHTYKLMPKLISAWICCSEGPAGPLWKHLPLIWHGVKALMNAAPPFLTNATFHLVLPLCFQKRRLLQDLKTHTHTHARVHAHTPLWHSPQNRPQSWHSPWHTAYYCRRWAHASL